MKSVEEYGVQEHGFEFQKNHRPVSGRRSQTALGKPTPLKWDDAQKWLGNHLSRGGAAVEKGQAKPRNSNADDRRLIAPVSSEEENGESNESETKKMDESVWRISKHSSSGGSVPAVRSICVRDMGTEMTPAVSQEPSRTATPIKNTTPGSRSPIASGSSTPIRFHNGIQVAEISQNPNQTSVLGNVNGSTTRFGREGEEIDVGSVSESRGSLDQQAKKPNPLETRAMAWDEAERAKYLARYKREEVKIQAWENHQKRKAEMSMRRMEVKADQMKSRAQEKYANKLAATKRIAEEKRANAESKLNEKAMKTSEKADYIRRTGHMPSSFSLKLPSMCW